MKDEALRLALEGFEKIKHHFDTDEYAYEVAVKSITAIKQALEQPEGEPVKVIGFDCVCGRRMVVESDNGVVASTPKREWQGLTDEEKSEIYYNQKFVVGFYSPAKFADAIEAKLKEKNNG